MGTTIRIEADIERMAANYPDETSNRFRLAVGEGGFLDAAP